MSGSSRRADFPNRVVTSFVGQAMLDGYETLHDDRYLDAAPRAASFLLKPRRRCVEEGDRRCVSYVPDSTVDWIVMDVSALSGALAARVGAITGDAELIREGGRLVRYVVSRQTDYGAWFYSDPPSASHITHDNYHTGFILDSILQYGLSAGSTEFDDAYRRGIEFYSDRLFEPSGAARFMSDRLYPIDIHGCAQGVITFSLQQRHLGTGAEMARRVLQWTVDNMWDPSSGWFYYQRRRGYRTSIRELRWCQGWMSWALASYLENWRRGEPRVKGNKFPGRELSLDPGRSKFERMYANLLGAPANGLRIRLRRVLPATDGSYKDILDAGCGPGVFTYELAKRHPQAKVTGVELEADLVARNNEIAKRAGIENVVFEQGDVTKLDFDEAFDLVLSVDNFEHVEDDIGAMRTLLRALRPGGGSWPTSRATTGGGCCWAAGSTLTSPGTSGRATTPTSWWRS